MSQDLTQLGSAIAAEKAGMVMSFAVTQGELTFVIERESVAEFLSFLRDDARTRCEQLMDVCGVDYPARQLRFEVVYNLLSVTKNHRIRVKLATDEASPVPSVSGVYPSAGWFEREVWDMYGVFFDGHPDLRRILTDYGFDGHPQRKDFPLTGFVELRYDEDEKRVKYSPVKLQQAYRSFDFMSPWEGADYPAPTPAPEKAKTA
ncbi:MAG: NADH-quinone oxidoreductase subunit C [Rickettsiales bacterium]|nr:NADH-quinone oxidoreductase subunit C [Rickettsiales bacterium]